MEEDDQFRTGYCPHSPCLHHNSMARNEINPREANQHSQEYHSLGTLHFTHSAIVTVKCGLEVLWVRPGGPCTEDCMIEIRLHKEKE